MLTQIELLKKYGLSVKGHLGQHLLIDPNTQRKIIDALDQSPGNDILEIGPGLGALTAEMLARGRRVWAIEKDKRFVEILNQELGGFKNQFQVIHADAVITDFKSLLPKAIQKNPIKLISNLPYYITAPLLFHILSYRDLFSKAILMMQKEVAARLTAVPGTKDYGRLTLGVRYGGTVAHLFDVAPTCFAPPPEVHSTVLEISFYPDSKRIPKNEEEFLFQVIETAFSQRRKTLAGLLSKRFKIPREKLSKIFQQLGFSETIRGEELLLKDFIQLSPVIASEAKQSKSLDCFVAKGAPRNDR